MNGFIENMRSRLRCRVRSWFRRGGAFDADSRSGSAEVDHRQLARRLTQELDRALDAGNHGLAERIAASASRIAPMHPQLSERLARLRLMQNDSETALRIIEACAWQSASLRLLRVVCLLSLGRRHEAHLELGRWCKRAAAPMQARQLLALLEWRAGDHRAAIDALLRNLKQMEDPETLLLLALMGIEQRREAWSARWIEAIHARGLSDDDPITIALRSAGCPDTRNMSEASCERRIATLAAELAANEHVIPALVQAQMLEPHAQDISILTAAIAHAMPLLDDQSAAQQALVQLQLIQSQNDRFDDSAEVLATIRGEHAIIRSKAA